jgi:hypothetical protein
MTEAFINGTYGEELYEVSDHRSGERQQTAAVW